MTYRDLFSHADMLSDIYEIRRSWAGDPTWKGISWFIAENDSVGEDNENTAITGVDAVMSCHLKETNLSLFVPFPLIPSLPSSLVFFHWFEKEWQRKWELETFSKSRFTDQMALTAQAVVSLEQRTRHYIQVSTWVVGIQELGGYFLLFSRKPAGNWLESQWSQESKENSNKGYEHLKHQLIQLCHNIHPYTPIPMPIHAHLYILIRLHFRFI